MTLPLAVRRCAQYAAIAAVRPYVWRELPGWGRIYGLVGDYRRDWLWENGPTRHVRGRLHGYRMQLDLSKWSDRATFFLGRWNNLEMQLYLRDTLRPGDTVIDVGANRGNFALCASRLVGPSGKVICFEPNPHCAETIRQTIADNDIANIAIHRIALGEQPATLPLCVPVINSGEGTLGRSSYDDSRTTTVVVDVRRGDDILGGDVAPRIIKLDVEGYEPFALRGLPETIRRTKPIIITEVVAHHLEACGSSVIELCSIMSSLGYSGRRLSLSEGRGRRTWQLSVAPPDGDCDMVWTPTPPRSGGIAVE